MKKDIKRRDFLKKAVVGTGVGVVGAMGLSSSSFAGEPVSKEKKRLDIGTCKKLKITTISETSWFDSAMLVSDIKSSGGLLANQYTYNWAPFGNGKGVGKGSYAEGIEKIKKYLPNDLDKAWKISEENSVNPANAGGYSALLEVTENSGKKRKFLLDSGWSYKWMDESFKREGVDKMLKNREIEALFISHEHFDHFWGLPVTLKYDPEITIYIPEGFYAEGKQYIKDAGHKGKLIEVKNGLHKMIPGMANQVVPVPVICRVYGEQSFFFNIKDKGLVSVTGCCHQGIMKFADTAQKELKYEKNNLHGLYGGLHISPFDDWDPKHDDLLVKLKSYGFEKMGCNHCTGILCVNKFVDAGYPVVKGSAKFRSKDKAYLGNSDSITFG